MSSLLEQAIVDATALKEAATKTAEKNFIDKYSHKIKEAVDKLLEQEMVDPSAPPPVEDGEGMDAASSLENTPVDPMQNMPSDLQGPDKKEKDPLEKIKSAFLSDGSDDELITIDFSSLKAKPVDQSVMSAGISPVAAMPAMGTAPAPEAAPPPMQEGLRQYEEGEDELQEEEDGDPAEIDFGFNSPLNELELDEEEMCEGGDCGDMDPEQEDEDVLIQIAEDDTYAPGEAVESLEEEEELEEDFELEESLIVDMEGVSDGWRGTQPNERREIENVELARLQDEEIQLKIREYEDAVEAAHKKVKKATKEKEVLMKENRELRSTLLSLKEHIEKMNISNAKLLYINRALTNSSLNERQKQQVVESIGKTDSVEAAKMIFETLQSSVQSAKPSVKAPKSLNEAVSRSTSPFLVRPKAQEVSPMAERMKILAGISK